MTTPLDRTVASEPAGDDADGDEAYCAACNQSFGLDHVFCPNDGARLVALKARPDLLLGRVFDGRYEIRSVLGHGGMGTVYRGWQLSVDREVAIKVIHPKLATVRAVAKRFLREARLSSRLSQPNIVNVYDFGQTDDGILYLVMEMLRGHPLARDLETRVPLALRRITAITAQICDGLEAAHGQGIIHRDLKPQNVVILDEPPGRDFLKILDFGLAKSLLAEPTSLVTQSDALLGTPLYMSPEQILGKPSDQRADLYSLGCMLYQMVSGRPPYIGDNINVILGAHIRAPIPPIPDATPPVLATAIQRLMHKSPDDRYAAAGLVRDAVMAIATRASTPVPEIAQPRATGTPPPAFTADTPIPPSLVEARGGRRRSLALLAALIVALAAAAIALVVALPSHRTAPPGGNTGGGGSAGDSQAGGLAGAAISDVRATVDVPEAADAPAPVDAGVPVDARVAGDARVRLDARVPLDARAPAPIHRLDAALAHPLTTPDAAPPSLDAGLPDLDLLPTRHR